MWLQGILIMVVSGIKDLMGNILGDERGGKRFVEQRSSGHRKHSVLDCCIGVGGSDVGGHLNS